MMDKRKKLSIIQQNVLLLARERVGLAQLNLKNLIIEVLKELEIPENEYLLWNFTNDFSFVEKIEPKKKENDN